MLTAVIVFTVLIGGISLYAVHPSAPEESWVHRLACVVPLAVIAALVLGVAGG